MRSIRVKPINPEFIIVWLKLHLRKGHSIDEFNLQPSGQHFTIMNSAHLRSLETDFANFRHSTLSMPEYFQCNIIIATRRASENFIIKKNIKLTYDQVSFKFYFWYHHLFSQFWSFVIDLAFIWRKTSHLLTLPNQLWDPLLL